MGWRDPDRSPVAGPLAYLPALLLGIFGGWAGTWVGGAGWAGSAAGDAVLLGLALGCGGMVAGLEIGDPLRLGRAGRLLPAALWGAALASLLASPVPRAGRVGILLLPLYLLLPGAVAACWRTRPAAAVGVRAVSAVAGVLSLWALSDLLRRGAGRAAEPLGHHNLLAAWLVILLPLAVLPVRERGAWRLLGWGSGLLGVAGLIATRSLAGAVALSVQVLVLLALAWRRSSSSVGVELASTRAEASSAPTSPPASMRKAGKGRALLGGWPRRLRWGLLVLLLAALATQAGRIGRVLGGGDNSVRARAVYLQAGWEGFLARPALGWGPGSTPWTAAAFLRPVPGVNPPSELVGDLHSLPVQLAYELGAPGFLLALALGVVFARRRIAELGRLSRPAERSGATDPGLAVAGLLGLLGAAAVSLASASVTVTALAVAAAVAAGAALAGSAPQPVDGPRGRMAWRCWRAWRWLVPAYMALALAVLLPIRLAARHAERAIGVAPELARRELARAVRLDPAFPLYRARLAWVQGATPRGRAAAAALARQAAEDAGAVIPLWLSAGLLGGQADEPWAAAALMRACDLDPLSAFPAFYLALERHAAPPAPAWAGRAFLADPRLAAAVAWERIPDVRDEGLRTAARWPGTPAGWRAALLAAAAPPWPAAGSTLPLYLGIDGDAGSSFSLYLFRRRVSPTRWPIRLRAPLADRFDFPPAAVLPETRRAAFEGAGCGLP